MSPKRKRTPPIAASEHAQADFPLTPGQGPVDAFYREAFDLSPDGRMLVDAETLRPMLFNDSACRQFGYSRDEFAGLTLTHHAPPGMEHVPREHARRMLDVGMSEFDIVVRTKAGEDRILHVWARLIDFGDRPAFYAVQRDVTEDRRVHEEVRLQSAALDAAVDAVVITDATGTIEWVNPAFGRLTGYSAAEAVGRNPRELLRSGRHSREFYAEMWTTILSGHAWHGEVVNRRKNGTEYTEEQTITPIVDAGGRITHFVAIKRDATERLVLQARLRQSQKMETVGQLASGIAHDFNNLLAVIIGLGELVAGDLAEVDPIRDDIMQMLDAAQSAATLTKQLLAFSRQQLLSPVVLNFNTVLTTSERLLRRLLRDDIEFVVTPAPDLGNVYVDAGQMTQVIVNLAVNARDAMPDGGRLSISTQNVTIDAEYAAQAEADVPLGDYVRIDVTDTGIGMDDATRRRVFEPFFTTKAAGKGTGLGLATVYGIVKQSKGFIWVYSEPGQGTRFHIYLPIVDDAPGVVAPRLAGSTARGSETILLVEDNRSLFDLTKRLLESGGFAVIGATSGAEALRLIERQEQPIHLLLTDVVMPGMSGPQIAEDATRARPALKVVYMSGYTDDEVVRHGVLDSSIAFINKPFTRDSLLLKIREVLDH